MGLCVVYDIVLVRGSGANSADEQARHVKGPRLKVLEEQSSASTSHCALVLGPVEMVPDDQRGEKGHSRVRHLREGIPLGRPRRRGAAGRRQCSSIESLHAASHSYVILWRKRWRKSMFDQTSQLRREYPHAHDGQGNL